PIADFLALLDDRLILHGAGDAAFRHALIRGDAGARIAAEAEVAGQAGRGVEQAGDGEQPYSEKLPHCNDPPAARLVAFSWQGRRPGTERLDAMGNVRDARGW